VSPTARPTIAIDVTPLLGTRTGVGIAVAELVDALQALASAPPLVPYTLSMRARLQRVDAPPGTRFVPLPARFLLRSWAHRDTPRIDRWVKPASVLHATNFLTPPSRLPTIVTVHDCSLVRYAELCPPEVLAYEPILRRAIARGATVHVPSEAVADDVEEVFGAPLRAQGRLVVVHWGVPPLGTESALPAVVENRLAGAPFVLAIGTLEPRKNYPHLIAAFAAVAAKHPEAFLVIAGHDGPARPAVDAAIARAAPDVRDQIVLAGGVTDAERRGLLDHATVLAYPSIYEGFGFPLLEAMSIGVPVVAARAGSIPEVAGDAALLVDATDEVALADALDRVIDDDALRGDLIARGRDRVHAFSWPDAARGLLAAYSRLADPS
jgi:glycosyltransferase involved in cell wall biosynthesis